MSDADDKLTLALASLRGALIHEDSPGTRDVIAIAEVLVDTRRIMKALIGPVRIEGPATITFRDPLSDKTRTRETNGDRPTHCRVCGRRDEQHRCGGCGGWDCECSGHWKEDAEVAEPGEVAQLRALLAEVSIQLDHHHAEYQHITPDELRERVRKASRPPP